MALVPLRVTIKQKPDGTALYPDFNSLPSVVASGMDWSRYVDVNGSGWLYDRIGHKEDVPGSPKGVQIGMLLVPAAFAAEAVTAFSADVSTFTEPQAQNFYETKHARDLPDEEIDHQIVLGIKAKKDLGQPLTPGQTKALDPDDPTPGIRVNPRKTWAGFKNKYSITT